MTISNRGIYEGHRFLYKNKFDTAELANDLGISRVTLERNIKKLWQRNERKRNIWFSHFAKLYVRIEALEIQARKSKVYGETNDYRIGGRKWRLVQVTKVKL